MIKAASNRTSAKSIIALKERCKSANAIVHAGGARAKAASLLLREERKSDKRQVLADALILKLQHKYAKHDPEFAAEITIMTNRLILHTQRRIVETDIVALETVVRKIAQEREQKRKSLRAQQTNHQESPSPQVEKPCPSSPLKHERGLPAALQGQDEWVLLNALSLVEYEKDKTKDKEKLMEKQRIQRAWLDAQQAEKSVMKQREKQQQVQAFQHQVSDYGRWQQEESIKKQKQQEQILLIRQEREEQLRLQKNRQAQRLSELQREEQIEVERVQRELKKVEEEAKLRRHLEIERTKKLQEENVAVQKIKSTYKSLEQQEDVRLMEAYAQRLAKEEADRIRALETKLKRQDLIQHGIAASIQEQQLKKAREDESRAAEYQRKRQEEELKREQDELEMRQREAAEQKQFLELQRRQKKEREQKEVEEDFVFAKRFQLEGKEAIEEQKRRKRELSERNKALQMKLIDQIKEQKQGQPSSPLHLPRMVMDSRERKLNAKLLQKLEEPEISLQVISKLSPSKPKTETNLTTSFY